MAGHGRKQGWTKQQQAESDELSKRMLYEYTTEQVPYRVIAERYGKHTSDVARRINRARWELK